jgi:hypothetical protein
MWARFSAVQESRPGRFAIAALMRPSDPAAGEDESLWLERARAASGRGPLGHHTHWTAPDHARPTALVTDRHEHPGARVLDEGRRLREHGLAPTVFCGGGWYTDDGVAEACAELGYVDCTPRAIRPAYLPAGERWASLTEPAVVELASGRDLGAIPTTHSLGDLARTVVRRGLPGLVHVYFHDTDLADRSRRALLHTTLRLLARRAEVTDLDALASHVLPAAPRVPWDDVARL